jgi:hypothetical protein
MLCVLRDQTEPECFQSFGTCLRARFLAFEIIEQCRTVAVSLGGTPGPPLRQQLGSNVGVGLGVRQAAHVAPIEGECAIAVHLCN